MLENNIRNLRKERNMSQDELAEKLGVSRQSISLWETGQTQPSLENVLSLASIFHVSTDALLGNDLGNDPAKELAQPQPPDSQGQGENKKAWLIAGVGILTVALVVIGTVLFWQMTPNGVSAGADMAPDASSQAVSSAEPSTAPTSSDPGESDHKESESKPEADLPSSPAPSGDPEEETTKDLDQLYGYFKNFAIQNGRLNGDYSAFSRTADVYGGDPDKDFSLYYWGDTDTVEFCLHSVIDDTFSINFYLYVPKQYTGEYEYRSSFYYRTDGTPLYEAKGTIPAEEFTKAYPLTCKKYTGSSDMQNSFMEMSRQGICDLLDCIRDFLSKEELDYFFTDLGFKKF